MTRRNGRKTADELMKELEGKPEYAERQQRWTAQEDENRRRYAAAADGLFSDLRSAGFQVMSLAELRRVGDTDAVPVLGKWLPMVSYRPLKRDIIATLGSGWAWPQAGRPLIEEFHSVDPHDDSEGSSVAWSIGDALERVADESVVDELVTIATDRSHGSSRGLIVVALGNMHAERERVVPVLMELLADEDVAGFAIMGLGKLRGSEAQAAIEGFVDHEEKWISEEAKKALAKLRASP